MALSPNYAMIRVIDGTDIMPSSLLPLPASSS